MSEEERTPGVITAFFSVAALFHGAALVTRFDGLSAQLPVGVAGGLLLATFPVLLVQGWFIAQIDDGDGVGPAWMRMRSKPMKVALALAFAYLAVVLLQTWELKIGPIDPSPPKEFPLATRARFFATMCFAGFFPSYLAATSFLVPVLRALGNLASKLGAAGGILALNLLGFGLGAGMVWAVGSKATASTIAGVKTTWTSFTDRPLVALGVALGSAVVPAAFGAVQAARKRRAADNTAP